jgi:hypothetical protein
VSVVLPAAAHCCCWHRVANAPPSAIERRPQLLSREVHRVDDVVRAGWEDIVVVGIPGSACTDVVDRVNAATLGKRVAAPVDARNDRRCGVLLGLMAGGGGHSHQCEQHGPHTTNPRARRHPSARASSREKGGSGAAGSIPFLLLPFRSPPLKLPLPGLELIRSAPVGAVRGRGP